MKDIHVNDQLEESPGGFIEAVKRTLVISLRRALTDSGLSLNDSELHVDQEYPFEKASYPAAWVQFSFTSLTDSGLGHEQEFTSDSGAKGKVRQWRYQGQVTISFMALSSLDRDRISDKFISAFAFSEIASPALSPERPSETYFLQDLSSSPYVSMTPQSGKLQPRGQSTSVGVPWDPGQLVYEDGYAFNLEGEFQHVFIPGEGYFLKGISIVPHHSHEDTIKPAGQFGWH